MNRHVLSGASSIVLSGARLSCHQAQIGAQRIDAESKSGRLTLITYRSFGSVITEEGHSMFVPSPGSRRPREGAQDGEP